MFNLCLGSWQVLALPRMSKLQLQNEGKVMSNRLWVDDNGTVVCDEHAGTYLRSAFEAKPQAIQHRTPLGTWCAYYTHLLGGADLVCEVCTPWNSPNHPYNTIKAGA
jgi:hypothetical protein